MLQDIDPDGWRPYGHSKQRLGAVSKIFKIGHEGGVGFYILFLVEGSA